ncbi:MAG: zinc-binding dehydrogenase [Limisphaerales bacterium]
MKAAVLHGKEDVRIEEIQPTALQAGEVRIKIGAALTCGTDLKVYKRGYHARMIVPPAVFGHEFAGTIAELGPGGDPIWRVGDRVVVANSAPCESCFFCRQGQENLCDDLQFLNGAYAESIVVPPRLVQRNMLPLKAKTRFEDAALTEPLACVVQGVEDTKLKSGERVLIIGTGPIGLMFVALVRDIGCEVTAAGRGETRLKAAQSLGAGHIIDVSTTDLLQLQNKYDVVIEAVGKPETWEVAVQLVRKGGRVNFFGGCPAGTKASLDTGLIHYSNLTLLASFHHTPRTIRRALEFIEAGVIRSNDFVNGACSLNDLPELFRSMAAGNKAVKTLIHP